MKTFINVKNLNGNVYLVDADNIFAVAADLQPNGKYASTVYGIWDQPQTIDDAPSNILNRLGLIKEFARFSNPVGELWVRPQNVAAFHAPFPGDGNVGKVRCLILAEGYTLKVLEDVQSVQHQLES